MPSLALDERQRAVVAIALAGQNVFFTGPAGTGKSAVLRRIVKELRQQHAALGHGRHVVAVMAPTGAAAVQLGLGATTVHRFAGFGVGRGAGPGDASEAVAMARRASHDRAACRWVDMYYRLACLLSIRR
jgi:cytidylate kinase